MTSSYITNKNSLSVKNLNKKKLWLFTNALNQSTKFCYKLNTCTLKYNTKILRIFYLSLDIIVQTKFYKYQFSNEHMENISHQQTFLATDLFTEWHQGNYNGYKLLTIEYMKHFISSGAPSWGITNYLRQTPTETSSQWFISVCTSYLSLSTKYSTELSFFLCPLNRVQSYLSLSIE
jgi:hypothetical protein